ncbi:MAG: NAD-dependent epimerase/dehydratase family protein [Chloroflexota bacterium]|jgi:UDP-glucuronate 4-epimerase|nr:NAD-dependent epimerase/dehydratase family protein [Chloroflexota bacterium]
MRIVVTGAAGFIGSTLCEALIDAGHEVVGVDAFIPYYPREVKEMNLANLRGTAGFRFHEMDLRTGELEPCVEGADAIIHEAAMAGLMRSWTDLELYVSCNILATNRLIEAAMQAGVGRFVLASTSSVYGREAVGNEDRPLEPSSPYGITKLACEKLVLAHVAMSDFPATIIRYFSIYGPRQRPDMAYHRFIEAMLDGQPITVYGDGEQTRSNTYVSDAVRGTILALERGERGGIYNVGGGRTISLNQAIETIAGHLGVKPVIRTEPARPGDQRHTSADISRARAGLGYEPTTDPEDGLGMQVAWHVQRREQGRP